MQISTQRKRQEIRRDKEEDRNNHAQRLKGVYSQRGEIKGKFKARLFFPAFRFRVHRREGAGDDVILFLSDGPFSSPFLIPLLYLQQNGRRSANPKLTNRPNNLQSVSLSLFHTQYVQNLLFSQYSFNPLNPELNPMCCLMALLGAHHFLHVSRIRVKSLTLRLLKSYTYGAPILDVSRSHTTTQHSR